MNSGGPTLEMLSALGGPLGPSVAAVHGPEEPSMAAALGPGGPIVGGPCIGSVTDHAPTNEMLACWRASILGTEVHVGVKLRDSSAFDNLQLAS